MKEGTKSILFGVHQFLIHPYFVVKGWRFYHGRFPMLWELICIFIHDWGIWGKDYLRYPETKKNHPLLGASIAFALFGDKGFNLVAGHSSGYVQYLDEEDIDVSDLYYADKYSWLLAHPLFLRWNSFIEKGLEEKGDWNRVRKIAIRCLNSGEDMHGVWAKTKDH
jgi:hypothetical protein